MATTILDLDDDVIINVFRRLPGRRGSFAHSLVCRHWRRLAYEALVSITFEQDRRCRILLSLLNFPNLASLTFPDNSLAWTSDPILETVSVYCPNLRELRIGHQGYGATFGEAGLKAIFRGCPKLELFTFESLNRSPVVIPSELGQAKNLQLLKIGKWENGFWDDSNLESMPETLGNLTKLSELTIASDRLSQLPGVFGPLGASLSSIRIRSMELSSLPDSMTLLTSLTNLELECMVLSQLPEAMHSLSALTSLTLSCCGTLTHLPETLGSLPRLAHLKLHSCRFLSELPASTTALSSLESLTISRCASFSALPKFFGRLKSLRTLHLDVFESFESLPESMGDMQHLEKFFVSAPGIKSLPNSFGRLRSLRELEMEGCLKLWYIPSSFGQLSNLRVLRILQCPMLSSLPGTCGQLFGLKEFVVGDCGHFHVPQALSGIVTFESPFFSLLRI
ncbi:hypothetical protein CLOM_g3451 [Closterium sp. NIES-68]|nr:hypothetical protein CLOM_g18253 [Closterium sp. NIES-68]GJP44055.1 hypothetical protein CLOM_g3451 [Closterium sp. NIES-68]GJP63405.1 hypothetical protein CLOP_g20491 [Closterium sp. NIES-67]